jgi:hypothetical protein
MRFVFLAIVGLTEVLAQQPKAGPLCLLSGQAVKADSGEPLRRVTVTARPAEGRAVQPQSSSTGADGRFEIKGLPPGQYRVVASRNGYLVQEYGQKSYGRPGIALTLAPGQEVADLSFRMTAAGAISGKIVNEDGERLAYVNVQALRQNRVQGRRQWVPTGMASSNDLGEYRIFGLAPGRYYLAAQYNAGGVRTAAASNPADGNAADESYAPSYYPGSLDPTRATPLELPPGGDLRGIDFNLAPTRSVRIRGRVKFESADSSRPFLSLIPRNATFVGFMGRHSAVVDEKGEFEIRGVTPGSYLLTADQVGGAARQSLRMPLEVGSTNLDDVNLVLGPSPELAGKFQADAGVDLSSFKPRLLLESAEGASISVGGSAIKPDGSFVVQDAPASLYALSVIGLPEDVWIKSVRMGDADFTDKPVDLAVVGGPLEISLASGAAQIAGSVTRDQQAAPGAIVVLVPDGERRKLGRYFKTAIADQRGVFQMKGLAPGGYKAFAWDELEDGVYQDPEFLQAFESKGKALSLKAQGQESVQLELLSGASPAR